MAKRGVLENLVARGENPNGVTQITANGVAHAGGDYPRNQQVQWPGETGTDGKRWNQIAGAEAPELSAPCFPGAAPQFQSRSTKRNRTGE